MTDEKNGVDTIWAQNGHNFEIRHLMRRKRREIAIRFHQKTHGQFSYLTDLV